VLTPTVLLVVIGAGVLHAAWNAITKHLEDRLVAFALIDLVLAVAGGLALIVTGLPASAALGYVVASSVIHVGYVVGLMHSYRLGEFNQTYPIARGTSPLLVALGAYFFANEHLGGLPLAGVIVLAVGLMSLALSAGRLTRHQLPAIGAAIATGITIASYSLLDGIGVRRAGDPFAYAALLFLLQGFALPVVAVVRRPLEVWRRPAVVTLGLLAGALSVVAYGAVLWAQVRAPLAEVAALRETSVIVAAVIGMLFFKERFGWPRALAATLVATGIILIAF
jgi:drug/metabolite transporter (DMT)-like permease